jgi:hypothetical protein
MNFNAFFTAPEQVGYFHSPPQRHSIEDVEACGFHAT